MNYNLIFFTIITIFFLSITLYLKKSIVHFSNEIKDSLGKNNNKSIFLPKFYYDIHFNSLPNTIEINNPYKCTGSELRKCKLSDPTSCIGCQNLIATCTHFDQDMDYIDSDGKKYSIAANTSSDIGYCLAIQNTLQRCNPYHGNLVLIQLQPATDDCHSLVLFRNL